MKGIYTVKPIVNSNYTFNPDSINFTIDGRNISSGLEFIATENYGKISGQIKDEATNPVFDLEIKLTGVENKVTKTILDGTYSFNNLVNGDYIITPKASENLLFNPSNRKITINNNNVFNVDFQAYSSTFTAGIIEVSDANFDKLDVKSNAFITKDIIIRNISSTDNLIITGYRNSNPSVFETNLPSQSNQLNLTIKPNGTVQFQTTFKPNEKRIYIDSIVIISKAKTLDSIAYLSGEGIDTIKSSVEIKELEISLTNSNEIIVFDLTGRKIATYSNYNSFKAESDLRKPPLLIRWKDENNEYHFQKLK